MNPLFRSLAFLSLTFVCVPLFAQDWNPLRMARGWARVDKDGSIALHDPDRRKVVSWIREGGVLGEVNVSGLPQALWYWRLAQGGLEDDEDVLGHARHPDKWVLDASLNAWVITDRWLQFVGKDGTVVNHKLPAEVGDLDWDTQGFYLSYRCVEPYIEKRGFTDGQVIWSCGTGKDKPSPTVKNRIAVTEDRTLVLSHPDGFHLDLIDGNNGKPKGRIYFRRGDNALPARIPVLGPPGPMAWWLGKSIAFQAVPAAQVPSLGLSGLLLARENLLKGTVDFLPTGLSSQHTFIGLTDTEAVFVAPGGGLVFLPIPPS